MTVKADTKKKATKSQNKNNSRDRKKRSKNNSFLIWGDKETAPMQQRVIGPGGDGPVPSHLNHDSNVADLVGTITNKIMKNQTENEKEKIKTITLKEIKRVEKFRKKELNDKEKSKITKKIIRDKAKTYIGVRKKITTKTGQNKIKVATLNPDNITNKDRLRDIISTMRKKEIQILGIQETHETNEKDQIIENYTIYKSAAIENTGTDGKKKIRNSWSSYYRKKRLGTSYRKNKKIQRKAHRNRNAEHSDNKHICPRYEQNSRRKEKLLG